LREIIELDASKLLNRLNYNVKSITIEEKIRKVILQNVKSVKAIILIGSAVQTSYHSYNDIDIIVVTKTKIWKMQSERNGMIDIIEKNAEKEGLKLDVQIISQGIFIKQYHANPSLIYQLKDRKIIYGRINLSTKVSLSKLDLMMKLDWSDPYSGIMGKEIYECIRNTWLVRLLMNKIVDNYKLQDTLLNELGTYLLARLKNNKESVIERRFALSYLHYLIKETEMELKEAKWEKIVL
jgi:predicted nucleotidyltransferase